MPIRSLSKHCFKKINEHVKNTIQGVRGSLQDHPASQVILAELEPVEQLIQALARKEKENEQGKGSRTDLGLIMMHLDRIEKKLPTANASQEALKPGPGEKPTWSEVAAGGKNKLTVEVRLDPKDSQETEDSRWQRIKAAIPGARGIILHPRAKGKISVVILSVERRDHILNTGIEVVDEIKLIRRPRLAMVMGIPLDTPITHSNSPENQAWIKEMNAKNAVKIKRVDWLYSKSKLEELRRSPQNKGSVIIELATETEQRKVVQDGLLFGHFWHSVKMWDVSIKANQCYKCWKWGHTQSICNSPVKYCGRCANQYPTNESSNKEHMKCAGCKKEGHRAWMTRECLAYKQFIQRKRGNEQRLNEATKSGQATTWKTGWEQQPLALYEKLPKHMANALFLLRTEVLGTRDWLSHATLA
ncbi:hypothetical protein K402DRAFT_255211 [Aulographum hederae CBS 113979]|uniref:CCHC-type domain-containing protein n=1 Tax=Aulographum hederae CBS 113979 TaxID=1176131 RepID=A0A6G1GJB3_9PEZI|nr:hypothetical protein K402DRAFT_255211 [Aulographum hederae CBS 113979]